MINIRNADGQTIKMCRRKNGIRKYAARHNGVHSIALDVKNGAFWLTVVFKNATSARANFTSYDWMKAFVYNWRGATGAPLTINGSPSGICEKKNFSIM